MRDRGSSGGKGAEVERKRWKVGFVKRYNARNLEEVGVKNTVERRCFCNPPKVQIKNKW